MEVTARPDGVLHIGPKKLANADWIAGRGPRKQLRFPPWLGGPAVKFSVMRGRFVGRLQRLREIGLPPREQAEWLLEEFRETLLEGYPISYIRALIHSLPTDSVEVKHCDSLPAMPPVRCPSRLGLRLPRRVGRRGGCSNLSPRCGL